MDPWFVARDDAYLYAKLILWKIKLADELLYGRSNVRFAKNRWEICREAEMRFVTTAALKIPAASSFYFKNFVIRTKSTW